MTSKVLILRCSHRRCSVRKDVFKNFAKFTGKHLCQSHFFNKVVGLRPATLWKKRLWHRCFPGNFERFFRMLFLQNTYGRLPLYIYKWLPWFWQITIHKGSNIQNVGQIAMKFLYHFKKKLYFNLCKWKYMKHYFILTTSKNESTWDSIWYFLIAWYNLITILCWYYRQNFEIICFFYLPFCASWQIKKFESPKAIFPIMFWSNITLDLKTNYVSVSAPLMGG